MDQFIINPHLIKIIYEYSLPMSRSIFKSELIYKTMKLKSISENWYCYDNTIKCITSKYRFYRLGQMINRRIKYKHKTSYSTYLKYKDYWCTGYI
jgi:hypothetical protein